MNLPNILTIFRILLTPIFIICLFGNFSTGHIWALLIFIVASITDTIDGRLARKYNQITREGKFLDPLADKILVSSAFISFAVMGLIPAWMVILIIFRDLFVTGLRIAINLKGLTMSTSQSARNKTALQMFVVIFILTYLAAHFFHFEWLKNVIQFIDQYNIIYLLALIVTIFTTWTGITYIYRNRQIIKKYLSSR